jgi:hypothetical protein
MTSVDMSAQVSHKLKEEHHADPRLSVASDILISLGPSQYDNLCWGAAMIHILTLLQIKCVLFLLPRKPITCIRSTIQGRYLAVFNSREIQGRHGILLPVADRRRAPIGVE